MGSVECIQWWSWGYLLLSEKLLFINAEKGHRLITHMHANINIPTAETCMPCNILFSWRPAAAAKQNLAEDECLILIKIMKINYFLFWYPKDRSEQYFTSSCLEVSSTRVASSVSGTPIKVCRCKSYLKSQKKPVICCVRCRVFNS